MSPSWFPKQRSERASDTKLGSRSTLTRTLWLRTETGTKRVQAAHSIRKVVFPERSELLLASDVPYCELYILVLHFLDVET